MIAEAWDAAGLYQVGHFPGDRWAEWNGRYRDDIRRFVKGDPGMTGAIASRLGGSADIYQARGQTPENSINFVTVHDGFTLQRSGVVQRQSTTRRTAKATATASTRT